MRETWVWSLGWEDPLQKEMATHSSILAWRIPWKEEPGGPQSMGLQKVGHDWATKEEGEQVYKGASQVTLVLKNPPANAGDIGDEGSIPGLGRSPAEGNGNPIQDYYLENPIDKGAW